MRTPEEVQQARDKICEVLARTDLDERQRIVFIGMSTALQWIAGLDSGTLGRLLSGEPVMSATQLAEKERQHGKIEPQTGIVRTITPIKGRRFL